MSLIARCILLLQERNQKRCTRCSLFYSKQAVKCHHCGDMSDAALKVFLEERGIDPDAKSGLGQFLVLAAIVVLVIFVLSKII